VTFWKVFGAGSPEFNEALQSNAAPRGSKLANQAQADFVGIGIHCGASGGVCAAARGARPDLLPDEPGGYTDFQALYGARYVNPAISGGQSEVKDLFGNVIADPTGNVGFAGFDGMLASVSLGYVAQMQEAGVPITYAYISDAHDEHAQAEALCPRDMADATTLFSSHR
jgi:hypothetical protein